MTIKNILGKLFSGLLILGIAGIIALRRGSIASSASRALSQVKNISFTRSSISTGDTQDLSGMNNEEITLTGEVVST